jgi:hypothetical protein
MGVVGGAVGVGPQVLLEVICSPCSIAASKSASSSSSEYQTPKPRIHSSRSLAPSGSRSATRASVLNLTVTVGRR